MNKLDVAGLVIFLCEGTRPFMEGGEKRKSLRYRVEVANTDDKIIKVVLKYLRKIGIDETKLRARVKAQNIYGVQRMQKYWSGITGIPVKQFTKPIVRGKPYDKSYEGNGVITIIYHDNELGKKINVNATKLLDKLCE